MRKYKTLSYKELVVNLTRMFLQINHSELETATILSGWHHSINTEERNKHIRKAMQHVSALVELADKYKKHVITQQEYFEELDNILGE